MLERWIQMTKEVRLYLHTKLKKWSIPLVLEVAQMILCSVQPKLQQARLRGITWIHKTPLGPPYHPQGSRTVPHRRGLQSVLAEFPYRLCPGLCPKAFYLLNCRPSRRAHQKQPKISELLIQNKFGLKLKKNTWLYMMKTLFQNFSFKNGVKYHFVNKEIQDFKNPELLLNFRTVSSKTTRQNQSGFL